MSVFAPAGNVSSTVDHNVGFHFALTTRLAYHTPARCHSLHVDYALPHGLFVDPYELDLRSDAYTYSLAATPDLERPLSAVEYRDTWLQLHVAPASGEQHGDIHLVLPLHGRYGLPSNGPREEAYMAVSLPPPTAFWRCDHPEYNLVPLVTSSPIQDIPLLVPVGLSDDLRFVESGTALSVLFVFAYLAYIFSKVYRRLANDVYDESKKA